MPKEVQPFRTLYGYFPYKDEDGNEKVSDTSNRVSPVGTKEG